MKTFVTADLHLDHQGILRFQKASRPFSDLNTMNEVLINNLNADVDRSDRLIICGDLCWRSGNIAKWRQRINCRHIVLVRGNHDPSVGACEKVFGLGNVHSLYETIIGGQFVVFCHYALRVWNKSHYGAWHCYGHSHGSLPDDPNSLSADIGVDCWNLRPVLLDPPGPFADMMSKKSWKPADHHSGEKFDKISQENDKGG